MKGLLLALLIPVVLVLAAAWKLPGLIGGDGPEGRVLTIKNPDKYRFEKKPKEGGGPEQPGKDPGKPGKDPGKPGTDHGKPKPEEPVPGPTSPTASCERTITAEVVALDQVYTYNRFGAFNPVGMAYALKRDVVPIDSAGGLAPGNVRLRDGKRPRPLVLRMNVGDCLDVHFTNLLAPDRSGIPDPADPAFRVPATIGNDNSTFTRAASFHVNGLHYRDLDAQGAAVGNNPSSLAAPGQSITYRFYADREGPFFAHSMGALAGGDGDGGSTTLGLFGVVNVEPRGSTWYRSQVTAEELEAATVARNPDGTPVVDYDVRDAAGRPILRMLDPDTLEIIHSDLYAIIAGYEDTEVGTTVSPDRGVFREGTIVFHDEIKAVQAFPDLDERELLHGVRDGFAVNYGAAGMGGPLLANRKKLGPAKDCAECKFEEFFLSSWPNGDPALNVEVDPETGAAVAGLWPDDPSNVVHAYLGDPVRLRNVHAGPKETHVFHLHAHQWLKSPGAEESTYLDSHTIPPGAAFTYDLTFGGAGNRNLTPGDAIFHCHLYPHFAQGMWGLLRAHDTFEDGSPDRNLPDGEIPQGTPTPAVVPLPGLPMSPLPTRNSTTVVVDGQVQERPPFPGYPHYLAAVPGRRAPQAPFDLEHDGGLPRHVITSVLETVVGVQGEFDVDILAANLKLLPAGGTPLEQAAMEFHAGMFPGAVRPGPRFGFDVAGYPAYTPEGQPGIFAVNGRQPEAGAPFADPCPEDAPLRSYRTAYVQLDMVVNNAGWHDRQARITVLEEDVEATRDGSRPPEPFFFRANSGECVRYAATNLMPSSLEEDDFQIFTPTDTVGQHIHLVKFDVTSSDGSANGWNYEDGTFAAEEVVDRIDAANAVGGAFAADGTTDETGERVALAVKTHPRIPGAPPGAQTTVQRWWADPLVGASGKDRTLRTVFSHDHFSPSSHQHHGLYAALVIEPAGSTWRNPRTGELLGGRADGGPTSWEADILAGEDSHREFLLAFADFALVYDGDGKPVNPPTFEETRLPLAVEHEEGLVAPEAISAGDPGTMLVNYRSEPVPLRIAAPGPDGQWRQKEGNEGELHNLFSSRVHGDPATPLLRGYEGDRVQIRLIQGAQEEQHMFAVQGQRWLAEPSDPDSGYVAAQAIGISEHFEMELSQGLASIGGGQKTADYLWYSAPTDDIWVGMWGLLRTYGKKQQDLLPLPSNPKPWGKDQVHACPAGAPKRKYTVHAILARGNLPGNRLVYNEKFGLYDPDAILYVKEEHLNDLRKGRRAPEPLVLRAAAGECLEVTLVNGLKKNMPQTDHWNYLPPIIDGFNVNQVRHSHQIGLSPQLVTYDVNAGDGSNAGYNECQTVPPGKQIQYTWYAGIYDIGARGQARREATPVEFGAVNLRSLADPIGHGMHGAIGGLLIEPEGATWETDPGTELQATVRYRDSKGVLREFREFVVFYQDEIPLHSDDPRFQCADTGLNCGTALRNYGGADDAEDSGHNGFNYRTEPFWARLGIRPEEVNRANGLNDRDLSHLLDSRVYGDPVTTVFTARAGQDYRVRLLAPSGHPRQHAFSLHGASWNDNPWEPGSNSTRQGQGASSYAIGTTPAFGSGRTLNLVPTAPAGGPFLVGGDFLYREQGSMVFGSGAWGLLRVEPVNGGGGGNVAQPPITQK